MYNHYVRDKDGKYVKVSTEEFPLPYISVPQESRQTPTPPPESIPPQTPPQPQRSPEAQLANKLLGHLRLDDVDSGDLLLLALLFFLFRQKADEELLIALGLLLIL